MHFRTLARPNRNQALAGILLQIFRQRRNKLLAPVACHLDLTRFLNELEDFRRKTTDFARLEPQAMIGHATRQREVTFSDIQPAHRLAGLQNFALLAELLGWKDGRCVRTEEVVIESNHNFRLVESVSRLCTHSRRHHCAQYCVVVIQCFPVQPQCLGPFLLCSRNHAPVAVARIALANKRQPLAIAQRGEVILGEGAKGFPTR